MQKTVYGILILSLLILFNLSACQQVDSTPTSILPITDDLPPTAIQTLTDLESVTLPARDLAQLTQQYKRIADVPHIANTTSPEYSVGDVKTYWVKDQDTEQNLEIQAILLYRSEHLNMWFQDGIRVREQDLQEAVRILENNILPRNHALFGFEWQPGIDGDNRLNILHSVELGEYIIGYFSSADEFVQVVNKYSNEQELLYINWNNAPLASDAYYDVIAHEHQHLIQWHRDMNETGWLSEGLAELAAYHNGYNTVDHETAFLAQPDTQLNAWGSTPIENSAHYGGSFLFSVYFKHHFGEEAVQALVTEPANGIQGFEQILPAFTPMNFNDLFADWVVTNYLHSHKRGFDIYQYPENLPLSPIKTVDSHSVFPANELYEVHQFATDYIEIESEQPVTFVFTGTRQASLLPAFPHSGDYYWTTVPADESNQTLTRVFDLTEVTTATLQFWSWYDIEAGWDYAYVSISMDGGKTWETQQTIFTTTANPQGYNYGYGLTGTSGTDSNSPQWIEQSVDLSPYAGNSVLLRFQYITDQAVHEAGFVVDDIRIPELGYDDDVETGTGNWEALGFVRHTNVLPQQFLMQALYFGDEETHIEPLLLNDKQQGQWVLPLNNYVSRAVIAISGITPVTELPASYLYTILPE